MSQQHERKQDDNLARRARFLKKKHKEAQSKELIRRSMVRESNSPRMIAKLLSVNRWKKLVCYTEDEDTTNKLYDIDESYKNIPECKSPIYATEDKDGLFFKVSVPQFMHNELFKMNDLCGQNVKIIFHAKSYENTKMGSGYYFTLAAPLDVIEE
jgi:hypothetical protein